MLRAALLALLLAFVLPLSLEAQRAGAGFRGFARASRQSVYAGQRGFSAGQFHRGGLGAFLSPYFLPDGGTYWSAEPGPESAGAEPEPQMIYFPLEPARPARAAQVIEIPGAANSKDVKPPVPAMFVLTSGERLEALRFVLTASSLSVNINRRERVIPLDALDLDATAAVNRERGINLAIPADRNEILLSF